MIFYDPPSPESKFTVHNNGHAIQVTTEGKFFVSNGGLGNVFSTAQFHFHWGHQSHHGSEHTLDGHASPIELHIVNWNSDKYSSISEAVVQPDGLAVLGMLFEISDRDNHALDPLVDAIVKVRDPDLSVKVEIPAVSMRAFLPQNPERYYRYKGSLTTPGCFESVAWTVFHEKLSISRRQLHVFRQALKSAHHRKRRSLDRQEQTLQDVLNELGIEDNIAERLRFKRALESAHAADTNADLHNTLDEHGKDEHTDPDEGQEPTDVNINGHGDTKEHNDEDHVEHHEETEGHVEDHDDDHDKHVDEDNGEHGRKALVNNYRPVQPLHGRTVYRSFPFFDDPVPVHHDVWETKKQEVEHLVSDLCPLLRYFNKDHDE